MAFIENAEILEDESKIENLLEEPKVAYTTRMEPSIEALQAIVERFPTDKKWTYTDLEKYFPTNLKIKVEIINKQIFIMATPNINHQMISDDLVFEMNIFVRSQSLDRILSAPMDVKFDGNNVV